MTAEGARCPGKPLYRLARAGAPALRGQGLELRIPDQGEGSPMQPNKSCAARARGIPLCRVTSRGKTVTSQVSLS